MALYHLLLDSKRYYDRIRPALSASWQRRSFGPCAELAAELRRAAAAFAERFHIAEEPLLNRVACDLPFDRVLWRALVGEVLWFAADEIPELQTLPETLRCLLAPKQLAGENVNRENSASIDQAHFGSRDLVFGGGYYRPEHAGLNDHTDVARLADYLGGIEPSAWTVEDLQALGHLADDDERSDELEMAREWFPALRLLYQQAREHRQVVVCEVIE